MMLPASMICLTSSGASSGGSAMPFASAVARVMSVLPGLRCAAGARRGGRVRLRADVGQPGIGHRSLATPAGGARDGLDDLRAHLRQRRQIGGRLGSGGERAGCASCWPEALSAKPPAASAATPATKNEQNATAHQASMASASAHRRQRSVQKLVLPLAPALVMPMWTWSRCAAVLSTFLRGLPFFV